MGYKIKKIVKKVNLFHDLGLFIHCDDLTIDKLTKTDMSEEDYAIAWFDKSINTALFDNCSKVQFAMSNDTPSTVTLVSESEDVSSASLYKSTEEFTSDQLKAFVKDHADTVALVDLLSFPPAGFSSGTFVKPSNLSSNNDNIKIAMIPLSDINSPYAYLYAWTIKSDKQPNGSAEIVSNN